MTASEERRFDLRSVADERRRILRIFLPLGLVILVAFPGFCVWFALRAFLAVWQRDQALAIQDGAIAAGLTVYVMALAPFTLSNLRSGATSLELSNQGCLFRYPSGKSWHFSWADSKAWLEIEYANYTRGSVFSSKNKWVTNRLILITVPYWSPRPVCLLTREADAAIQTAAREHGFSVQKSKYWDPGNACYVTHVTIYGPGAKRRRPHKGEKSVQDETTEVGGSDAPRFGDPLTLSPSSLPGDTSEDHSTPLH